MKKKRAITIRFGSLGLSLLAAGITAIGFAAVSLAASGGGGTTTRSSLPPPPPGAGAAIMHRAPLSAADRKKMQEFQQCMQADGAPAPPRFDPNSGPPKPPSAADQQAIQKAYETCRDKLPSGLQNAGPPHTGVCGPPPMGAPPAPGQSQGSGSGSGSTQNQSNPSTGSTSTGSSS